MQTRPSIEQVLFSSAQEYEVSSATQFSQGTALFSLLPDLAEGRALDVGCGNGLLTLEMARQLSRCQVDGIDVSPDMVEVARGHVGPQDEGRVHFEAADLFAFAPPYRYQLVFSNATMHWLLPANAAYGRLSQLLVPGGELVVCQGGRGCYFGLWELAAAIVSEAGVSLDGWHYPASYPTKDEMEQLLARSGFSDIEVYSWATDGSELPSLYKDFASAGLLPFARLLPEALQEGFRAEFLRRAEAYQPSRYTHRVVAHAVRR